MTINNDEWIEIGYLHEAYQKAHELTVSLAAECLTTAFQTWCMEMLKEGEHYLDYNIEWFEKSWRRLESYYLNWGACGITS